MNNTHQYGIQVADDHYEKKSYLSISRWSTYSLIIEEALRLNPKKILEIGPGPGLVSSVLKRIGFSVTTLDIDPNTKPDYRMSITDIKENQNLLGKFDLTIASEVFEHIRYEDFVDTLNALGMISKNLIITLPDTNQNSLFFAFRLRLPIFNSVIGKLKVRFKKIKHQFDGQHYWEIGKKSFPLRRILYDMKHSGWMIQHSYANIDNPYHRFFILKNRNYETFPNHSESS